MESTKILFGGRYILIPKKDGKPIRVFHPPLLSIFSSPHFLCNYQIIIFKYFLSSYLRLALCLAKVLRVGKHRDCDCKCTHPSQAISAETCRCLLTEEEPKIKLSTSEGGLCHRKQVGEDTGRKYYYQLIQRVEGWSGIIVRQKMGNFL